MCFLVVKNLRIAYPAGRNRWQVEFHIRLQPNAEKQNWAHRLYDHARAREGVVYV